MARSLLQILTGKYRFRFWRASQNLKRWRRAWHYARERLTADEAQDMILECRQAAGWYALLTLSVQDTLEAALQEYQDHPWLRDYVASACAQVSRKWEPSGDERWVAQDWAIRLVAEYAAEDDVVLTPLTGTIGEADSPAA